MSGAIEDILVEELGINLLGGEKFLNHYLS